MYGTSQNPQLSARIPECLAENLAQNFKKHGSLFGEKKAIVS